MAHDIIDNREEKLADHIGKLLDNAQRARFAVGYFFLSGFKAIAGRLEEVEELRLLIGSTTSRETVEALVLSRESEEAAAKALEAKRYQTPAEKREAAAEAAQQLTKLAAQLPQTDEDEDYIKQLARLVRDGKIKVKVFTKGVLHAKAYIADFKDGQFHTGAAIVGSSNLSLSGVSSNTELNVVVPGNENHEKLGQWFDELWADAEDFDESLMHVLESSWAIAEPTPYELYLKVVYELVKERLDEDEGVHSTGGSSVPELYNYQREAVMQARGILRDYGGVFLADVVGLGKTYMGAALLADLYARTGEKAIIICPPVLKPQWEYVCDLYDLPVHVVSRGKLNNIEEDDRLMNRPIVLVDESHHFRHQYTKSYQSLERICYRKKVILITATPYNTEARDLLHQIKLFNPGEITSIPIDPPSLNEFFQLVEKGERKLPDLLEHVMVRRTRRHITDSFPEDIKDGKLRFPKRAAPQRVEYSIDEVYPGIYDQLEKLLGKLEFARYNLYQYVKPEHREDPELSQLKEAGKNLVALMKTMLFKRMESSVAALRRSVKDQAEIHKLFLEQLNRGYVPTGLLAEELSKYQKSGDDERLEELIEQSEEKYKADKFKIDRLKEDIEKDMNLFQQTFELVQDLKPENDAKLKRLSALLNEATLKGHKVLIFTEFATTANYIGEELVKQFPKADFVSGASKDILDKVKRFAPKANRVKVPTADELLVLVTTDILAEGLNLQDCNIVVSYDLHWNPVRLIQRVGRVDRVSTEHSEIHTFNFLPEREAEARLGLEQRLTKRFNDIHKHLGLDSKYISQAEQLSDVKLFKKIYTGDESALEEPDEEADVSFAELIKMLRDLRKSEPEVYKRIATLPDKMRSARRADLNELVVFCKHNEFAMLYLADESGKVTSQDQIDILKKLRCQPNTKPLPLPAGFNAKVREVEQQFKDAAAARIADRNAVASEPIVRQTIKKLNTVAKKVTGTDKKTVSELRERLNRSISPQQRSKLRSILRQTDTPADTVAELKKLLLSQQSLQFGEEQQGHAGAEPVVVHIIASEALIE